MNGYFLIPTVAVIINIFIGAYVLGQRQKGPLTTTFLIFSADVLGWVAMEFLYHIPALYGLEIVLLKIGSIFWIPIGFLFLNFAYAVVGRPKDRFFYAGMVFSVAGIALNLFTDWFIKDVEFHEWGINQVSHPIPHAILIGSTAFFGFFGLVLVFKKWRLSADPVEKKVCGLIFLGGVSASVITIMLNAVLPDFFPTRILPQFGNTALEIFLVVVFYAVTRYRFLSISVESVAEDLFEDVKEGILLLDRSQRIRRANREARRLLGSDLVGRSAADYFDVGDLSSGRLQREITIDTGREKQVISISSAASDNSGHPIGQLLVIRDITAQKRAELLLKRSRDDLESEVAQWTEQLRQVQKMEALGTIAGSIARDFNNLLAAILGFTHAARNDLPASHPVREDLNEVLFAGARAKEIIRQILSFSRKDDRFTDAAVEIDAVVQDAVDLLRVSFPTTIYISCSNELKQGVVRCDPAEIIQVLMNLGANALQAMQHRTSGELRFVLRNQTIDPNFAAVPPFFIPGEYVVIEVHDSGEGMDVDTMARIFDPFFTTKSPGEGTGLGLSIAIGIVQSLSGTIRVESQVGQGSTFYVYLPAVSRETDEVGETPDSVHYGTERILLLDDDAQLRRVATRMLGPLGYQVRTAASGTEGARIFEAGPDEFDLVITDHAMPNMTGLELAARLRKLRPNVPIILISGYLDGLTRKEMDQNGITDFLKKPFTQAQIAECIRAALNTPSDHGPLDSGLDGTR